MIPQRFAVEYPERCLQLLHAFEPIAQERDLYGTFLKLIGCTNQQVGEFAKFVKRRNKIAHPTGTVFFNDQAAIDAEIADMMREVRNIEAHMQPVILELYDRFLKDSADPELREYADPVDEVTANFVHRYYMSEADLAFCRGFDITALRCGGAL